MPPDPQWFANDVAFTAMLISVIALGVAIMSALYSRRQAKASERQASANEEAVKLQARALTAQSEDTRRALALAERDATAAEASAASTKFLVEIGQRPWLNHTGVRSSTQATPDGGWAITGSSAFLNSGNTPAFHVSMEQWHMICADLPASLEYPRSPDSSLVTLGPQATVNVRLEGPIAVSKESLDAIRQGAQSLYVYGIATYSDILEKQHVTTWCLRLQPETNEFGYTPKHNGMT